MGVKVGNICGKQNIIMLDSDECFVEIKSGQVIGSAYVKRFASFCQEGISLWF